MQLFSFNGRSPRIDPTAFVAPTATLIGDVTIEAGASVWFGAILRADDAPIVVREGANVQDGSVLHVPPGVPVDIGPGATIAHMCLIHGANIGAEALIGNHATVLDGAVIGSRTLVAAGCDGARRDQDPRRSTGDRLTRRGQGPDCGNRRRGVD